MNTTRCARLIHAARTGALMLLSFHYPALHAQWAQNWNTVWNSSGTDAESAYRMVRNIDGGALVLGAVNTNPSGFLVRTAPSGAFVWSHRANQDPMSYGLISSFVDLALDPGGSIAFCGNFNDELNDQPGRLVYLDQNGDTLWTRSFDTPGYMTTNLMMRVVVDPATSNITVAGSMDGGAYPSYHRLVLARCSPTGQVLWQTIDPLMTAPSDILLAPDGGVYVCGTTNSDDQDLAVQRFSATGALLWSYTYDGHAQNSYSYDESRTISMTSTGMLLVTGLMMQPTGYQDLVAVALDSLGNELNTHVLGASLMDTHGGAELNPFDHLVLCGNQELPDMSRVPVLYVLNDSLNLLRADPLTVPGATSGFVNDLVVLANGDVMLAGKADDLISSGNGSKTLWYADGTSYVATVFPALTGFSTFKALIAQGGQCAIAVADYGPVTTWDNQGIAWGEYCFTPTGWSELDGGTYHAAAYPAPFTDHLQLDIGGAPDQLVRISLHDTKGRALLTTTGSASTTILNIGSLSAGVYVLRWSSSDGRLGALLVTKA